MMKIPTMMMKMNMITRRREQSITRREKRAPMMKTKKMKMTMLHLVSNPNAVDHACTTDQDTHSHLSILHARVGEKCAGGKGGNKNVVNVHVNSHNNKKAKKH